MAANPMDELNDLLKELESIKASQKALAEKEVQCKEDLLELMKENGIEKEETSYGSIRLQRRYEKDYGAQIRTMEVELKETKKLADDMGDYEVLGFKESLVYTPPKDLF
jgi:hypothetical protein